MSSELPKLNLTEGQYILWAEKKKKVRCFARLDFARFARRSSTSNEGGKSEIQTTGTCSYLIKSCTPPAFAFVIRSYIRTIQKLTHYTCPLLQSVFGLRTCESSAGNEIV